MNTQTTLKVSDHPELTWIDICNPTLESLNSLAKEYGINESSIEDCMEPHHLPKFEKHSNYDFILIRVVDPISKSDVTSVNEMTRKIAIFIGNDFIITIHRASFAFIDQIRDSWKQRANTGINIKYKLCYDILLAGLNTFDPFIDRSVDFINSLEQEKKVDMKRVYRIRAQASTLKRLLRLSQEVCVKITSQLEGQDRLLFQDLKEDLDNTLFFSEDLNENIYHFINLQISIQSQKTNETMRIMALFSAFFMPLTFIAGLYGMNFKKMPELDWELGYPFSILLMATSTLAIHRWFKKNKWL